jgi:hypothetical protein
MGDYVNTEEKFHLDSSLKDYNIKYVHWVQSRFYDRKKDLLDWEISIRVC